MKVVILQKFDGSFDFSEELLTDLNIVKNKPEELSERVWMTLVVLKWLENLKDKEAV